MRKVGAAIAVGILITFVSPVVGQSDSTLDSITFGSVMLRLGTPRDVVLRRFADDAVYRAVSTEPNSCCYQITSKAPPIVTAGSIRFDSRGLLEFINTDWNPYDQQAGFDTVESLYNALTQITKPTPSGHRACPCVVEIAENPRSGLKTIFLSNATKTIDVSFGRLRTDQQPEPLPIVVITETVERSK